MKKVTILYFAAVRDLVGRQAEQLELPENVRTIGDFVSHLGARHESLRGALASVRIAKNEVFADSGETLGSGDVLALIPPVQGG